jgi:O-antigen ligase
LESVIISVAALFFLVIYVISPLLGIAYLTAARNVFSYIYATEGSFELSAEGVVTLLVIVVGIFSLWKKRDVNVKSVSAWPFWAFIIVGAATFFVASDHINFFKKFSRLIGYLFLYLMVQRISIDKRNIRILSVAILLSIPVTVLPALYYIKMQSGVSALAAHADEKMGLLSKNNFGFYSAYMTFFLFYPLSYRLYPLIRYVAIILLPTVIAALLLSYTRAAWVGFFAALLVFLLLSDMKKKIIVPFLIVTAVVVIFSSMLYQGLYVDTTQKRENGMSSWDYRTKLAWPASIKCITESPILGYGLGNDIHAMKTVAHFSNTSHNDYLIVTVETGLLGLSSYLLFLGAMYVRTYKAFKTAEDKEMRFFCLVTLAVFTVFIVGSVAEQLLQTPGATGYVITMLGMAHGTMNAAQRKQSLSIHEEFI